MILYEVLNAFAPCTMTAKSFKVASLAAFILGHGACGLEGLQTDEKMPVLMFSDPLKWYQREFNATRTMAEESRPLFPLIADALDSLLIGDAGARRRFDESWEASRKSVPFETFRRRWVNMGMDSERDICGTAWAMAKNIRMAAKGGGA